MDVKCRVSLTDYRCGCENRQKYCGGQEDTKRTIMNRRKAWSFVKLTRPLFLGGAVLLYLLGVTFAVTKGQPIAWGPLVLGQLLVTSIQLMTHYANEYYDFEVDRLIADRRTPFSGGSGVLVSGQLDRTVALHAARACMAGAIGLLIVCGFIAPWMFLIGTIALLGGYFYSAPPLALEGSGFGELDTALLTTILVPLTGYVMQTGRVDPSVVIKCAPLFLIYLAMILTFELADYPADQALSKRNITVRIGPRRAAWLHNGLLIGGMGLLLAVAPDRLLLWLALPLAVWQIIGVVWRARARSGWQQMSVLCGGAVLLAGLIPALWMMGLWAA
jgi:1,4-dihydroxy-2-naphthoate octaprenyltransferase